MEGPPAETGGVTYQYPRMAISKLERNLSMQLNLSELPSPETEYKFAREVVGDHPGVRKRLAQMELKDWRFDFAWPNLRLAVEVEGGQWNRGRHTRGKGFDEDLEKYDAAARLGWFVYRCNGKMIDSGRAIESIRMIIKMNRGQRPTSGNRGYV